MKMQNAELNLKGATVNINGSKIARTSVKTGTEDLTAPAGSTRVQERMSEQAINCSLVG